MPEPGPRALIQVFSSICETARMWSFSIVLLSALLFAAGSKATSPGSSSCPAGCYCDARPAQGELRVNCHPMAPEEEADDEAEEDYPVSPSFSALLGTLPEGATHLDLAKYGLDEVDAEDEEDAGELSLLKLDLQGNRISHVEEGAFARLPRLQVLDLSRNRLEALTQGALTGLVSLRRLRLADNRIQTVESGALDFLPSLSRLELADNPLVCDCNLGWLLGWLRRESGRVSLSSPGRTRCALPMRLAEVPLLRVKPEEATCSAPPEDELQKRRKAAAADGLSIQLRPEEDQVRGRLGLFYSVILP